MTRDDIISMAREAGFHFHGELTTILHTAPLEYSEKCFERLAALIAAAEREACAQICDRGAVQMLHAYKREGAARCAEIIRARSTK